jgi:hypothetical protein
MENANIIVSPAAKSTEFCWRRLGNMIVAPAWYDDSACVVAADCNAIHALAHYIIELDWQSPQDKIDSCLISLGYTPIW